MKNQLTDRQKIVIAAMAAVPAASFESVHVQKLFFLIDERLADKIGGRQFNFQPYHFGPFDKSVYEELAVLDKKGLVEIGHIMIRGRPHRSYSLSVDGQREGRENLENFNENVRDYLTKLSTWVRDLSFAQLVGSIYRAFPEMRKNSIFRE